MRYLSKLLAILGLLAPMGALHGAGWGRISAVDGDVFIIGVDDARWGYATINTIVEEGDIIKTDENSRVEIQLSDGSVVRLDELSEAEFTVMHEDDISLVTVVYGIVEASVPYWARMRELHLAFTGGDVEPYRGAKVRVEVDDNGDSYVIVRRERAILHLPDGDKYIRTHRIAYINPNGELVWVDRYYDRDSFDRWCDMRDRDVLRMPRLAYGDVQLGVHIHIGLSDLDMYGHWRRVPGYGLVWVPDVGPGWRPYSNGHWIWSSRWGWVWVPYEPWGWVPFHYGRWAFVVGVGWIWVPGYEFAPAWVAWSYGTGWIAWAPLDPWGNPIVIINNITIINIVDYNSFCDPVYRYRPPVRGRYTKPYRSASVKFNPNKATKSFRWRTKPPVNYAKPTPPPPEVKTKIVSARVRAIEVVEKSPIVSLKPQIVQRKIEREISMNPELKSRVSLSAIDKGKLAERPKSDRRKGIMNSEMAGSRNRIKITESKTDDGRKKVEVSDKGTLRRPLRDETSDIAEPPAPSNRHIRRHTITSDDRKASEPDAGKIDIGRRKHTLIEPRYPTHLLRRRSNRTADSRTDDTRRPTIKRPVKRTSDEKATTRRVESGKKDRSLAAKKKDSNDNGRTVKRDRVSRRRKVVQKNRKTDDRDRHFRRSWIKNGSDDEEVSG